MAHGYYNLQGKFITTSSKAEATDAWRKERGYSTGGVYDVGGGEVVDTRRAAAQRTAAAPTPEPTPAATLADTFAGYDVQSLQSLSAPTTAPTVASAFLATSGYGAEPLPYGERASAGIGENVLTGGGSYQHQQTPATTQPTASGSIWERTLGALSRGAESNLEAIGLGGEYHSPWITKEAEPKVEPAQYTGRQYYMGGSEQAYLGPVKQAEEYFFGTGDRWGLGSSYIDIAPEDRKPPPILNQSTVRILTKSGPSYLEGVDYGPSMTMEDIERIYEYDPATGHYLLKGAGEPALDYGYTSSGQGYASAGPGYGSGYGYGSRGGQIGGGLVNWRIGF